nr:MAG TPA: hypothetical protein [Caudoviricetes sp.]
MCPILPDCSGNSAETPAFRQCASGLCSYCRLPYPWILPTVLYRHSDGSLLSPPR